MERLLTAGVYGWDEDGFREALARARPDVVIDVRRRRGLRGRRYAFANSRRLQEILAELGIRYVHRVDVAPSDETRAIVARDARGRGIGYRERDGLAPAYVDGYRREVLDGFDARAFVESLGPRTRSALLFCVEGTPHACHRSLLAERIADELGLPVEHMEPPGD